jgi:hypothetical protein
MVPEKRRVISSWPGFMVDPRMTISSMMGRTDLQSM